jgi:hypothetical protein
MKSRVLTLLAFCTALAAQDRPAADRFVPKDSCLVVRVGAPAVWQQRFAKTQLAKLLQGPTMAPLMTQLDKALDGALDEVRGSGTFDADLLQKLRTDYRGEIVASLQVDFDDLGAAMEENRPPRMSAVIALAPDGSSDLGALGTALCKLIEEMGTEAQRDLRDVTIGEHKLRAAFNPGAQVTLPAMIDDHLVMVVATDLEAMGQKLLGADERAGTAVAGSSPLHLHADLRAGGQALLKVLEQQMTDSGAPFDGGQVLRDTGLMSLHALSMTIDAEDSHLVATTDMTVDRENLGVFGLLMVDRGRPKLMRYVPPAAESWSTSGIDVGALLTTVAKIWGGLGEVAPMSYDDAMAAFTEAMKVRLREDLIDHIGNDLLIVSDVGAQVEAIAEDDEENPFAALGGMCFAVSLKDGKKFGEALETALRARGLHAARKSEEYQGTKVHALRLAGAVELEYAVTDDLLLLVPGAGEASRQYLRGVLDARAAGGHELSEDLQKRLEGVREGWNGITVTPVDAMLEMIADTFGALRDLDPSGAPFDVDMVIDVCNGAVKDLRQLGLHTMIGVNYLNGPVWQGRMRW